MNLNFGALLLIVFLLYIVFTILIFALVNNQAAKWTPWAIVTGLLLTFYIVYCMIPIIPGSISSRLNAIPVGDDAKKAT